MAPGWEHPRDDDGEYVPLLDGWPFGYPLSAWIADWREQSDLWSRGEHPDQRNGSAIGFTFAEWHGERPDVRDHMPEWPAAERTGWCYYESTTEGTPLSPVFATADELAEWLAAQPDWRGQGVRMALDYVRRSAEPDRNVHPGYWKIDR